MSMIAKYAATCGTCRAPVRPGDKIEWVKGSPVRHVSCAAGSAQPVARTGYGANIQARIGRTDRGGKWTGCSCGSREDAHGELIPSPRNCASCEHDA